MTPDLTADMRSDDREALRDAFESGQVRRAFNEATQPCRPRVVSYRYPWHTYPSRLLVDVPAARSTVGGAGEALQQRHRVVGDARRSRRRRPPARGGEAR